MKVKLHPLRGRSRRPPCRKDQRGATLLLVLVLMSVMVLSGLAFSTMTSTGAVIVGNVAMKDRSVQASEAGVNAAAVALQALIGGGGGLEADTGGWYYARMLAQSSDGRPSAVTWDATGPGTPATVTPAVDPRFEVRYVVERLCDSAPAVIGNVDQQCLRLPGTPAGAAANVGQQFRVTVRVHESARNTTTYVQALLSGA